ncbi:MAG: hypothetical protein ABW168_08965 [Sedimenticola sp.]
MPQRKPNKPLFGFLGAVLRHWRVKSLRPGYRVQSRLGGWWSGEERACGASRAGGGVWIQVDGNTGVPPGGAGGIRNTE